MEIILATINAKWIHPSLALRLLKANLGELEDKCEILEFALRQPLREKVEGILAAQPRILGLSVSIWNHKETIELFRVLNGSWQKPHEKPVIVLGGPEVSWLDEDAEIFRYADYIIRGEGEESFAALCRDILSGKPLRSYNAKYNKETTVDLNKINTAYHLYTDEDIKGKLIYAESSRGCPFSCEFCQAASGSVRYFHLEQFLTDMDTLIHRGARIIKFLDRTFNLNMDRVGKIMTFFLERINALDNPPEVHFEFVPSVLSPELKNLLRRFPPGTLRLEIGIQTLNPETAALIKRPFDSNTALETLQFLRCETNALLHIDLIAGLPGEDLASFGRGFDRLWQILSCKTAAAEKFEIQSGILKCLPGTPISRHNENHKMRYSPEPPYEVIETGAIPEKDMERLKNFARFWEIIVNRYHFPELAGQLFPAGQPAFEKFMDLSDRLLAHFGKNWGIERDKIRNFLQTMNR